METAYVSCIAFISTGVFAYILNQITSIMQESK